MASVGSVATVAALIAEPARTAMLVALMGGRWLTAGELCTAAGVTAPTGSSHLRQLLEGRLVKVWQRGRHRYFQLTNSEVAKTVEHLMALTVKLDMLDEGRALRTGPRDPDLRYARVCYDHLAGELAVAIAERMSGRGLLEINEEAAALTSEGMDFLERAGVTVARPRRRSVQLCRPCLDWSARRAHIGGAVGRSLFDSFAQQGWIRRSAKSRVVAVTRSGRTNLEQLFGPLPPGPS